MSGLLLPILFGGPRTLKIPLTAALPAGSTFTRAGNTATMWQGGVLIGPLLANTPRFETDVNGKPTGYLNEPAATNIYLNSQAPATQTITVTAQAYTLSFYGTGSIALTGTYTGTLSGTGAANLVQLTFTPTAGALVATLTGTVTNVQVEAGSIATSRIITGATAVTRNADNLSVPISVLYPWWQTARGITIAADWTTITNTPAASSAIVAVAGSGGTSSNGAYIRYAASVSTGVSWISGGVLLTGNVSLAAVGSVNRSALSFAPGALTMATNGVSATPVAPASVPKMTTLYVGQIGGGTSLMNGHIQSITLRSGPSSTAWLQGGNY